MKNQHKKWPKDDQRKFKSIAKVGSYGRFDLKIGIGLEFPAKSTSVELHSSHGDPFRGQKRFREPGGEIMGLIFQPSVLQKHQVAKVTKSPLDSMWKYLKKHKIKIWNHDAHHDDHHDEPERQQNPRSKHQQVQGKLCYLCNLVQREMRSWNTLKNTLFFKLFGWGTGRRWQKPFVFIGFWSHMFKNNLSLFLGATLGATMGALGVTPLHQFLYKSVRTPKAKSCLGNFFQEE